jgi:hypothetical protein
MAEPMPSIPSFKGTANRFGIVTNHDGEIGINVNSDLSDLGRGEDADDYEGWQDHTFRQNPRSQDEGA